MSVRQKMGTWTVLMGVCLIGIGGWLLFAQEEAPAEELATLPRVDKLFVEYAQACQRLAEADLAEALARNSNAHGAVSKLDLLRLQLQTQYAEQLVAAAEHGADASEAIAAQIELQSRLADFDLENAKQLHQQHPQLIGDAQLAQLEAYAEVCRLRLQLTDEPHSNGQLLDQQLHWQIQRLSEEVQLLRRQVDQLQSLVLQ